MATSMKLALVTLGISQAQILRTAAKNGRNLNPGWLCKIVNGDQRGSDRYREAIVDALAELGMPRDSAERLLP